MNPINVPTREQVSPENQAIFDKLQTGIGFVPNLYAVFAHSEHALGNYMALQAGASSLDLREREAVILIVSEVNHCLYSLSAHTAIAKKAGFSDQQIVELRGGTAPFDARLDTLARLVRNITVERGHIDPALLANFMAAGFSKANLIDIMMVIGDRTITSLLYNVTQVPLDFPAAAPLPG